MRDLIVGALVTDTVLNGLGVVDGSVFTGDVDTPGVRPFVQLRYGATTPGPTEGGIGVNMRGLTAWVHDLPNDYSRIDAIIQRMKVVLRELVAVQSPLTSAWLTAVEWQSDSDDLADDGHRTITRNTSYTIIGSSL